jgi:PPM family protein phosphatase
MTPRQRPARDPGDSPTVSLPLIPPGAGRPASSPWSVHVDLAGLTHRGKVRPNNEDHFLIARLDRALQTLATNLPAGAVPERFSDSTYGLLVADGMGGRAAGEVASRSAISMFVNLVLRTPDIIMRLDEHLTEEVLRRLDRRFQLIREGLIDQVRLDPSLAGMGTTMTVVCSAGPELVVAHVGDSRAYLFRQGQLQRLTRDQTMAQFLADTGLISAAEIDHHPMRHVLTQALGTGEGPTDVHLAGQHLADGDQILICTDGLTDMVPEPMIADVLRRPGRSAASDCKRLVNLALERGGKDNVTVVAGRYRIEQSAT